jgi:uncharacterized damage-inducible protein DinB
MPASPYLLGTDAGMSPAVSGLIGMLRYARTTTVHAVSGLTMAQLDHRHDGESNSIAMLLAHIAAVEAWYQAASFDGRDWTAAEAKRWNIAADLGPAAAKVIRARALESYLDDLASVRSRTERELEARGEDWLLEPREVRGTEMNGYWMWFHVCEDEINHRGQIRWLRKRLPTL